MYSIFENPPTNMSGERMLETVRHTLNPVELVSSMESELEQIRQLALARGRIHRTDAGRLDSLEEAMLDLFEARLDLLDELVGRPRESPAVTGGVRDRPLLLGNRGVSSMMATLAKMRDSVELMNATVRFWQRRVENMRTLRTLVFSEELSNFMDEGPSNRADRFCRETGRLARRGDRRAGSSESPDRTEDGRVAVLGGTETGNQPRWQHRVPVKRSKFTC